MNDILFSGTRFAVIDFETTGLSPDYGDRAIEIGIVVIENEQVVDTYQSLMNPGVYVPGFITELTGISQNMVNSAPASDVVMLEVSDFISDSWLVAHNAAFDRKFLEHELNRIGVEAQLSFLCTMLISRRLYPWAENHKLKTLVDVHNIQVEGKHHRALADALMAANLLLQIHRDMQFLYRTVRSDFLLKYQTKSKALTKSIPKTHVQS